MSFLANLAPSKAHLLKMMFPAAEKSRSFGTEVAGIARCFTAMSFKVGNIILPVCSHHIIGSVASLEDNGNPRYWLISAFTSAFSDKDEVDW
jgi:hypothetical protein